MHLSWPDTLLTGFTTLIPSTTQLFGPTASVLRYNVFSRLFVTILNRVFDISCIWYYDDFWFLIPDELVGEALRLVKRICSILGVVIKEDKRRLSEENTPLGISGIPPSGANDFALTIALTPQNPLNGEEFLRKSFGPVRFPIRRLMPLSGG